MLNRVNRLKLTQFRSHKAFQLVVDSGIVAIYGKNGSGKTNILEAISLLSAGRGLRGAKLSDMSYFDGSSQYPWSIFFEVEGKDGEAEIGSAISEDNESSKRLVKINGEKQRGQNTLAEHISVFSLTPSEDQVFASGVTSRREFLDKICTFFYPDYSSLMGAFSNLKSQRRNLLVSGQQDQHWLSSIEQGIAEKSVAISDLRNQAVKTLNHSIIRASDYGFPSGSLSIIGDIENFLISNPDISAEEFYKQLLQKSRSIDALSGRTGKGVHKSDFRVIHKNRNMPAELCSQGEQKAMLLSLTISAVLSKKSISGVTPILLLDEVYSHLDKNKRAELYNFISNVNCQTWLTGTEKESFEGLENCQFVGL